MAGKGGPIDELIGKLAPQYGLDPNLVRAMVQVESGYKPNAVSSAGAQGLMQLMPSTAAQYGLAQKDVFDAEKNLTAGMRYMKDLLTQYNGNLDKALAAYNAGPGALAKYNGEVPPYKETQSYLVQVKAIAESLDRAGQQAKGEGRRRRSDQGG